MSDKTDVAIGIGTKLLPLVIDIINKEAERSGQTFIQVVEQNEVDLTDEEKALLGDISEFKQMIVDSQ